MNQSDEIQLVSLMQKDDSDAFERLFHLYNKKVYAFACNMLSSGKDAEEIVQNVFMAIWDQRKNLQISSSFQSYLFGIARHMICDFIDQKIRHEAFIEYCLEQKQAYSFVTEEEVIFRELDELLQQLLLELPERRREIFRLSRTEGLSYKAISERLGISENTVDTQIRHALDYLRIRIIEIRGK